MNSDFEILQESKNLIEVQLFDQKITVDRTVLSEAVQNVYLWQFKGGSGFTCRLLQLIAGADTDNKKKIAKGFPEVMLAYLMWYWKDADRMYIAFDDEEFFSYVREWLTVK